MRLCLPVLVIAAATVLAGVAAYRWTASGLLPISGDEPHYLIIAASVLRDGDFEVGNDYAYDASANEICDCELVRHALQRATGWWPQHMPGLGVLLALPFGAGGAVGGRVGLALLVVPVLGVALYRWSRSALRPADATYVTAGLLACSPVVFGASQMYPDLPAGVAIFGLVGWLWSTQRRTQLGWCAYWLVAGLLCWLHVKYYAPSAVLAAAGIWQLWRDGARYPPVTYVAFGLLFLLGPALFGAFSIPLFGNMLGGRPVGELHLDAARGLELGIGLHLDQVHGLFIQQPLLLPGLAALGWMVRRRHPLTLPWLVLYASLIAPNALQRIDYGGHAAPAGRFGWTAMWLWLIPMGLAAHGSSRRALGWTARLVVLIGVAYQAALAAAYASEPQRLFNGLFPADQWQPSLFPPAVMLALPKLGPHADLSYPPNVVWTIGALALLAAGFLHRSRLRVVPVALAAVVGWLTLPVEDVLGRSSPALRRYEAEHSRARCEVRPSPEASNGRVCRQSTDGSFAVAGPFISLEASAYEVAVTVLGSGVGGRGVLEVVSGRGRELVARRGFRVPPAERSIVELPFHLERAAREVEFRVRGRRGLDVDYVELRSPPCLGARRPVRVRLQASERRFLSAENGGGGAVRANRDVAGPGDQFLLAGRFGRCLESGDAVFLLSPDGSYLRAESGGGGVLGARGTIAGPWERFLLHRRDGPGPIRSGDALILQVARGHTVSAAQGGDGVLRADGERPGLWETFRITSVPGR
ncbi:MAG: hypothetical protein OXH69_25015 [Acidobacteria bacterium]|nr:hypothetical protein [Acidobacteriota bacterium]